MQIRTLVLLIAVACTLAFVLFNWAAITAPGSVSLGVTTVVAPLGVILLAILAVLAVLFIAFVVQLQTALLFESRRHAKELAAQRSLADTAEASRFTELRNFLDAALRQISERDAAQQTELLEYLARHEAGFLSAVEVLGNGVAAHIGQLEDRIERAGFPANPEGRR
jgi:mannitol-specific phosphotransferase system IIBC component